MIKEIIATGTTVDEAKDNALSALGAGVEQDVQFEIIDLPQKKTLGLFGGCPAKVRAYIEVEDEPVEVAKPAVKLNDRPQKKQKQPKPAKQAEAVKVEAQENNDEEEAVVEKTPITDPAKQATADRAEAYLKKILSAMDIEAEITASDYDGGIEMTLNGDNIGAVVGRRGDTLDALQYLTVLAANSGEESYQRIILNTGNYRNKRQKVLQALAKRIASQAAKNGKSIALEPMNPYERRIIHITVHDIPGVMSWSIGSEPYRRVVIGTSKDARIVYNNRRDQHSSRGGHGGSRGGYGHRRGGNSSYSAPAQSDREIKKDMDAAPLYGRIDTK